MDRESLTCNYQVNENLVAIRMQNIARILGFVAILIGLVVLFAWDRGTGLLGGRFSILPPTNPLSAIEIILCGLAIISILSNKLRRIVPFLSFLIITIALLKILNAFGLNIPIDQIFFSQKLGLFDPPSRMAPITAISFMLSGLSFLLIDVRIKDRPASQRFALLIIAFSLLFSLGYLFGSIVLPELRLLTYNQYIFLSPMSPYTAYVLVLIGLAILLMRSQGGIMGVIASGKETGVLTRRLTVGSLVLPIIFGYIAILLIENNYIELQLGIAIFVFLGIILTEVFLFLNSKELEDAWTQRCIVENEITKARAFDEALLTSIGDSVVAMDNNGLITYLNKTAEETLGLKTETAIGKRYSDLWSLYDKDGKILPTEKRPVYIALKTGKKITSILVDHYNYIVKDKMIPIDVTITPIIINDKLTGIVEIFRDISVEVGIDKAKSEFISLASHQLRTPVTAIGWIVETFMKKYKKKLTKDQYQSLEDIHTANNLSKDLINDFLNVSRIELNISKVVLESVNVISLIKELLLEEFKLQISEKKIEVTEKYDKDITINSDQQFLKVVLENLISNAIKYTPQKGKVIIEARHARSGEIVGGEEIKKDGYLISVADNGYGIPENQQNKIFSKLFRADNVRKKEIEGTGLGLYMVKLFIERLSGEAWFESEENKGSTFYIYLP